MNSPIFLPDERRRLLSIILLVAALFAVAPAQADPAGRVGRLALLTGSVQLSNPETGESFAAPVNQPLTSGDILMTEPGARAEVQIGSMTLRLDGGSRLEFDRIDDDQVQMYLVDGSAIAKLPTRDAMRDFALETRRGRFTARDTGVYRFDVDGGETQATAYYGRLNFVGDDRAVDIDAGDSARIWPEGSRFSQAEGDDFSHWSSARDQRQRSANYSRYVSPEMTGAEDLDAYGDWAETPEYGAVWTPRRVAADWAPYRDGHWDWVAPWGWTWVGREPWGFAPFHYGRWVQLRGAWAWVPGTRVARPVYAPALVAWIGSPGAGISLSVGWFPLAPREVYVPVYRSSPAYVRNVNVAHVPRIEHIERFINAPDDAVRRMPYAHRDQPHAVTFVPANVVTQRRPVGPAMQSHRDPRAWRDQPLRAAPTLAAPRQEPRHELRSRRDERERPEATSGRRERENPAPVVAPRSERQVPEIRRENVDARERLPLRDEPAARTPQRQQRDDVRSESIPSGAQYVRSNPPQERPAVREERRQESRPDVRHDVPQPSRHETSRAEPPRRVDESRTVVKTERREERERQDGRDSPRSKRDDNPARQERNAHRNDGDGR